MSPLAWFRNPALAAREPRAAGKSRARRERSRGQVLVIFAGATFVLFGLSALVIDVSWYWAGTLRVQRAADAAALAGVVSLPGNVSGAQTAAQNAAVANGYSVTQACQSDGATPKNVPGICSNPDPENNRQLDVTVSANVNTFFMRLFGINQITATRSSKAQYVVPVPMGSPDDYYGVYQLTCVHGASGCPGTDNNTINDALLTTTPLVSRGFFGAVITTGGSTENGDLLNPTNDKANGIINPSHADEGYDYTVVVPSGGGGKLYIFDPTYCGTGQMPSQAYYGEGDHWIVGSGVPVNTYYRLWDTKNTPLTTADDTLVASSGYLFTAENQTDQSGTYGTPQSGATTNCAAGKITNPAVGGYWHNRWWLVGANVPVGNGADQTPGTVGNPTGTADNLPAGTYRLQVTTTDPASPTPGSLNANVNAENMFSIDLPTGGQVYGSGSMANWYNITNGSGSTFYLAQIDKSYAGKTLQINLWDVGDNKANSYLKFWSPAGAGGTQQSVDFTYTSTSLKGTAGPSGSISGGSLGLQTTSCSGSSCSTPFNDMMLTILIPLDSSYGTSLWNNGWWQVEYDVSSGNDTTTWQVQVRGKPVHLTMP
jgi:Flp pilus assembly protein TadG